MSIRHTEATRSVASATARDVSGRQQSSAWRTVSPRPAMNRSWTALVGHGVTAPRIKRQPPPLPGPNRPSGHRGTDTLVRFGVRSLNHLSVNSTLVRQPGVQSLRTRTAQTKKINCLSADMVFGTEPMQRLERPRAGRCLNCLSADMVFGTRGRSVQC